MGTAPPGTSWGKEGVFGGPSARSVPIPATLVPPFCAALWTQAVGESLAPRFWCQSPSNPAHASINNQL